MILAYDQYEQTIRLAWGEDPESVEVEEYELQEEALLRVQELAAEAEKIIVAQESSFAQELRREEGVVSHIPRLEAVYWGLRDQVKGESCLILSIGRESCVGGVVKGGQLIEKKTGRPELTLYGIWQGLIQGNPPLQRMVKAYLQGKSPQAEREVFEAFLKALQGEKVQGPIPFSPPLKLPHMVKPVQELLSQLDPQREVRTLILTDWASYGSLPELLREDYQVVCSKEKSLTDAVRGMVLFGRENGQEQKEPLGGEQKEEANDAEAGKREAQESERREDIGRGLLAQGKDREAISWLDSLYEESPENEAFWLLWLLAHVRVYNIYGYENDVERVLSLREISEEEKPHAAEILRLAGKEYLERGKLNQAESHLHAAQNLALLPETEQLLQRLKEKKNLVEKEQEGIGKKGEIKKGKGRFFALLFSLCALAAIIIGLFWMFQRLASVDKTIKELEEKDKRIAKLEEKIESSEKGKVTNSEEVQLLRQELARLKGEINKEPQKPTGPEERPYSPEPPPPREPVQSPNGQEYVQKMIVYASVDGGVNRENEILAAKRDIEELRDRQPVPPRDRKEAKKQNEMGLKSLKDENIMEALKAFRASHQADPIDVEIANNLGYTEALSGDSKAAEQHLLSALLLAPDRGNAWANLGQTYAKQGNTTASVACFANAYRFSRDQNKTYQFLRKLAEEDDDARVRDSATRALQLGLVRARGDLVALPPQVKPPEKPARLPEKPVEKLPLGRYRVVRGTRLFSEPREDAPPVAWLDRDMKVNVVAIVRERWLRIKSSRSDKPPGYLRREDAVPAPEEPDTGGEQQSSLDRVPVPLPSPTGEVSDLTREADTTLRNVSPVSKEAVAAFATSEASRLMLLERKLDGLQRLRLETFSRQGLQAHQQKRYREAAEAYETLLTIDSDNFAALFNLAGAYYELNQPDTGIEYAIRAIRRNADPGLYFVVASAYAKKGDRERAFAWLGKAIEGGFTDRAMIQENFAAFQNDPVYRSLIQRLS